MKAEACRDVLPRLVSVAAAVSTTERYLRSQVGMVSKRFKLITTQTEYSCTIETSMPTPSTADITCTLMAPFIYGTVTTL